jgi:hypothetical protein
MLERTLEIEKVLNRNDPASEANITSAENT